MQLSGNRAIDACNLDVWCKYRYFARIGVRLRYRGLYFEKTYDKETLTWFEVAEYSRSRGLEISGGRDMQGKITVIR